MEKKQIVKKCKVCKSSFKPMKTTQTICSPDCAVKFMQSDNLNKKVKVLENKILKEKKKTIKVKVTRWKNKLQTEVQKIARLIDHGLPCLATKQVGQIHGGHVYAKGGNPQCRFDLHNIHRQCAQSNNFQSDDHKMWEGLREEYGEEYYNFVKSFKNRPIPKYTDEDYHEFYRLATTISKELSQSKKIHSKDKRILLRNEVNFRLNIYNSQFINFN